MENQTEIHLYKGDHGLRPRKYETLTYLYEWSYTATDVEIDKAYRAGKIEIRGNYAFGSENYGAQRLSGVDSVSAPGPGSVIGLGIGLGTTAVTRNPLPLIVAGVTTASDAVDLEFQMTVDEYIPGTPMYYEGVLYGRGYSYDDTDDILAAEEDSCNSWC